MTETAKLTASDGAVEDQFGTSISIAGDTVVVGSPGDDTVGAGLDGGSAYVFVRPPGGWSSATETARLVAFDAVAHDRFGRAVAVEGSTGVAGADLADVGPADAAGALYVFDEPGAGWATGTPAVAKLTASDGASSDQLGASLAMRDGIIVAGATRGPGPITPDQGAAYVFARPAAGWKSATEARKLAAADGATSDGFASSVALGGGVIVVGAGDATVAGDAARGAAYVFGSPVAVPATTPLGVLALIALLIASATVLLGRRGPLGAHRGTRRRPVRRGEPG